jgi:hypothetical protein
MTRCVLTAIHTRCIRRGAFGLSAVLSISIAACRERAPEPTRRADASAARRHDAAGPGPDAHFDSPPERRRGDVDVSTNWRAIGSGVSVRDLASPTGHAMFVALAGWRITDESTRGWVDALVEARLHALGVERVYAVRGPADVSNRTHDLAVTALLDDLVSHVGDETHTILVAAHSSGELVATEMFHRLFVQRTDHGAPLRDRILFVSLDGDADVPPDPMLQLAPDTVAPLRHAWFVTARDSVRGTQALSNRTMRSQQARFPDRSEFLEYDARDAGCSAVLCVHLSLVHPHPLPRGNASYAQFGAEGPNVFWIDATRTFWR